MGYNPNFRGSAATGSSASSQTIYTNSLITTLATGTPVSVNTSGELILTDVTSESSVEAWLGLAAATISGSGSGLVASDGRLYTIPLSFGFAVGDAIWIGSSAGTLTNIKPSIGVGSWASGDFVVFVGVVVQNDTNMTQQDIQLCRQIIGQL